MKRFILYAVLISGFFLLSASGLRAEDEKGLSGKSELTLRNVNDARQSWKFEEYREVPGGVSGEIDVEYEDKEGHFLEFKGKDLAEDDQKVILSGGSYGKFKIDFAYDKIPHRFAYDAKTLYSGVGTGTLTIADSAQSYMSSLTGTSTGNLSQNQAAEITKFMNSAALIDLKLVRERMGIGIDAELFYPFNVRFEINNEERKGTRQIAGNLGGFGNNIEMPEPIDYNTREFKLTLEYPQKIYYIGATYYLSQFTNNIDTLTFDNPFRITDRSTASTTSTSASTNTSIGTSSRGRIDLYPNNKYQNFSLVGAISLPLRSKLSATGSLGTMEQNDSFVPYTINSAVTAGSLPQSSANAKVETTLYNVNLTSKPLDIMDLKARYRYYNYDNKTAQIEFPGYIYYDNTWAATTATNPLETEPLSYKKTTYGIDLGFNVLPATTLGVGYTYDQMDRNHTREVAEMKDNIYKVSLDSTPVSWLGIKASYEIAGRRIGDYHYENPYTVTATTSVGPVTAALPWLRKYDEADRDRSRIQLLLDVYPTEAVTLTGSVIIGKDDFINSKFGILSDEHQLYSLDATYSLKEGLDLHAFYIMEQYKSKQKERQWNPGSTSSAFSDPYYMETNPDSSNSNWDMENTDKVNTVGAWIKYGVMEKVDLDLSYAYSASDGEIKHSSPKGTSSNDFNAFIPVDFTEVDDATTQTVDAKVKYDLMKSFSVALGFMWEKFEIKDFNLKGFTNVPTNQNAYSSSATATTLAGQYSGSILMGTLPKDYNVNVVYTKLSFKF